MRVRAYLLLCFVAITSAHSQIVTRKISTKQEILQELKRAVGNSSTPELRLPPYDFSKLIEEDRTSETIGARPYRFGKDFDVSFTLSNGKWEEIDGRWIWKLRISSPNAYTLNLIFSNLRLNQDSELFIYSESMLTGPIHNRNLGNVEQFWSEVLDGSILTVELQTSRKEGNEILISKVVHGYREVIAPSSGFGSAAPCNIDINCTVAAAYHTVSSAVARILVDDGTQYCSGVLMNNTCQDGRPFFLTAFHCLDNDEDEAIDQTEVQDISFTFQYKSPSPRCDGEGGGSDASVYYTYTGATLRSAWWDTDFVLVEMNSTPTHPTGIAYSGWNRLTDGINTGAIISHSRGDVMKVAFDSNQPFFTDFSVLSHPIGFFWETNNSHTGDYGTTETASSGGGLFDQNARLIGQQYAVTSNSSEPYDGRCSTSRRSFSGRLDLSWTGGGTAASRLIDWLDPSGSGATTLNTRPLPFLTVPSPALVCTTAQFSINNVPPGRTVNWSVTPTSIVTPSTGAGSVASLTRIGIGGGTISFTLSGCGNNQVFSSAFHAGPYSSSDYEIIGPGNATCNQYVYYTMPILPGATSYNWVWPSEWTYDSGQGTNQLALNTGSYSSYGNAIQGGVNNTCGQSGSYATKFTFVSGGCGYGFTASPNPSSDELTVTFNEEEGIADEKDFETENEMSLVNHRQERIYVLKSFKKKVVIPIKILPDGLYILVVTNKEGAVAQQVLIEHK